MSIALQHPELREFPLFKGLAADTILAADALVTRRDFSKGDLILRQGERGDRVCFLLKGVARVLMTDAEGGEITAKLFMAPAVFGEMEALTDSVLIESVEAVRPSTVLSLSSRNTHQLLDHHPDLTKRLLLDVCRRFRTSALNQAFIAFGQVGPRLAALIHSYAAVFGHPIDGGVLIVADGLTQQALAQGIGATQKSVQRTLDRWKTEGLMEKSGAHFLLKDQERLGEIAGQDAPRLDYKFPEPS